MLTTIETCFTNRPETLNKYKTHFTNRPHVQNISSFIFRSLCLALSWLLGDRTYSHHVL